MHFRVHIYHAWNHLIIHMAVSRVYIFRRRDAFLLRLVGEHRSESDIANTSDVRDAGIELVVDHDAPARIDIDADIFGLRTLIYGL